jgi:aldehyde dehydrogenase (NAD+)
MDDRQAGMLSYYNGSVSMNVAVPETNKVAEILESLNIEPINSGVCGGEWIAAPSGGELESINPADGLVIAKVQLAGPREYDQVVDQAAGAFESWRMTPAPQRGEIVREIGNELRLHKAALGALVSLEMGKILAEGLGEVQEMIDIADFAVGLSRQLYAQPCIVSVRVTACTSSGTVRHCGRDQRI